MTSAPVAGGGQPTMAMSPTDMGRTSVMAPMTALEVEIVPGRTATMANGPAREQFLLELRAGGGSETFGGIVSGSRTPMNLCLVIDRSGSMEGQPLEFVKQACSHVVDLLSPTDVLSIVTFEEMVEVLMPPQQVTNKDMVKAGISRLQAGNTTNLYDGISLAMQQIMQFIESNRATRMIVLTDGDPTAGIKDYTALVNHAGELRSRGISVTFLGFGPDYNEELLAGMAKKAGGNYYFIPQPQLIPEIFRSELEKLMTTVTRNMSLELKLARWVSMRAPQQATDGGSVTIPLADMERGSVIQQVIDLEFPNHPLGHYRVLGGKLSYEDLLTGEHKVLDLDFEMEFSSDSARYSAPVNPRVGQAATIVASSKAIEKTVMGLKTGAITQMGAIQELQKTQMLLVNEGRTAEAQEVTMALRALQTGDKGAAEKTLMGTFVNLDTGKSSK
ncbi:MAG: VWA domain-containing protein [Armatimonadetes bacterium]|nr:VWA domain-containing protein [Armatimonadota bacterium]MBS1727072.1 VWA domain-containing protein [Armatimonadota bacterium]